jgi:hypothetical protein
MARSPDRAISTDRRSPSVQQKTRRPSVAAWVAVRRPRPNGRRRRSGEFGLGGVPEGAMDRSQRDAVVRRDGLRCRACVRRTRGQVHHILGRGQGGSDAPGNLVTLCGRCHMLVSPIPVDQLMAYFGVCEAELLIRRARVELAIHSWVLSVASGAPPEPSPSAAVLRTWQTRDQSPSALPEWKKLRPRAGRVWEPTEDAALLAELDAGLPLEEIAARRGRGLFAVNVRLCKLGRVPQQGQTSQNVVADRPGDTRLSEL